jgi:hypothetical protein
MSDSAISGRQKGPPLESDLSQVIAHGPALSTAYGRYLGALLMLFAIAKARRGPLGYATVIGVAATALYHMLWRA